MNSAVIMRCLWLVFFVAVLTLIREAAPRVYAISVALGDVVIFLGCVWLAGWWVFKGGPKK